MSSTSIVFSPALTPADRLVLGNLATDIREARPAASGSASANGIAGKLVGDAAPQPGPGVSDRKSEDGSVAAESTSRDAADLAVLAGLNDPASATFEPSVFSTWDLRDLEARLPAFLYRGVLLPYEAWARRVARHPTDAIMVTHLLLYACTSVPSAVLLFWRFAWWRAALHVLLTGWCIGAYTLMRHQHIHQRGVLARGDGDGKMSSWTTRAVDQAFPYLLDPLMGHTWNSYYYHHVKHHHVEGNGPDDLSSTVRYQRDSAWHFFLYVARFYLLVWLDLPLYFLRKGRPALALRTAAWELADYACLLALARVRGRATFVTLLLPLLLMRVGLMVGNWGQHAFVDADEPDSDYRSSITLIDVPSNRYCYNDGYHTSHHLNPLRHWRDHPAHLLAHKQAYAREGALVFHDVDYVEITVRLLMHDYDHLARRLVPLGPRQRGMTLAQRADLLRRCTRRFSEDEIREKFGAAAKPKTKTKAL
ncbi:fatty acid desaturase [Xylariaceae sp. FL0804]|nr:fatty acid desaturase [Xylariaceae sp. FL0804]